VIYVGQAGWSPQTGQPPAASPCAFVTDWTISKTTEKTDVTAQGDGNKVYVAGLPDASGDFSFWYDDASTQTYAAATDGLPRSFYLYESSLTVANYWFGVILPDFSVAGGVGAAVSGKAAWSAAGPVQRSRSGVIG
jgi:hypothetical protein